MSLQKKIVSNCTTNEFYNIFFCNFNSAFLLSVNKLEDCHFRLTKKIMFSMTSSVQIEFSGQDPTATRRVLRDWRKSPMARASGAFAAHRKRSVFRVRVHKLGAPCDRSEGTRDPFIVGLVTGRVSDVELAGTCGSVVFRGWEARQRLPVFFLQTHARVTCRSTNRLYLLCDILIDSRNLACI